MDFSNLDCLGADPTIDDVATGKAVLKRGSNGSAVSYVQEHLAFTGSDIDGDFGTKTEQRVKEFQIAKGLKADGAVGKDTLAAIDAMVMSGQKFSPVPTSAPVVSAPVKKSGVVSAPSPASIKVPDASAITITDKPTPYTTYAAYVLGGIAALGLGYAVLKR